MPRSEFVAESILEEWRRKNAPQEADTREAETELDATVDAMLRELALDNIDEAVDLADEACDLEYALYGDCKTTGPLCEALALVFGVPRLADPKGDDEPNDAGET